jgi:hypothetical protein
MNTPVSPTTVNIQDDTFYFSVFLVNGDNRVFSLRPDAIKQLVIRDNFTSYYQSGYLIVDNRYDAIEQPSQVVDKTSDLNTNGFIFKGAARDVLRIEIMPKLQDSALGSDSDLETNSFFRLSYEFIIYNIEEILGEEPGEKYKKLYFHDIFHELLCEKNIQFSTTEMTDTNSSNLSNNDRSQFTGDIIKYIINKSINVEDNLNTQFSEFDQGSTKLFFSAPTNFKAVDCINYVLERHVSSKNNNYDQCFLRLDRYPKKWSLVSLSDIFKRAYDAKTDSGGPDFLEKMLIGNYGTEPNDLNNFSVIIERSPKLALYLPKYGTLDNFTFVPAAGTELQLTTSNRNVHSYNFEDGSFNIDVNTGSFNTAKEIYFDNYVKPMKGQNKSKPVTTIVDNRYRTLRQNIENIYSTSEESQLQRLSLGQNIFLTNSLLLNSCISFRVKGATYRQAGCFISIDKNNAIKDSDFDNKLLGIYFIVEVKHIFAQNTYYNDLICIKTYLYKDIKSLETIV